MPSAFENGDGSDPFDHVVYNDSAGTADSGSPPVKWRAANSRFSSYVAGGKELLKRAAAADAGYRAGRLAERVVVLQAAPSGVKKIRPERAVYQLLPLVLPDGRETHRQHREHLVVFHGFCLLSASLRIGRAFSGPKPDMSSDHAYACTRVVVLTTPWSMTFCAISS